MVVQKSNLKSQNHNLKFKTILKSHLILLVFLLFVFFWTNPVEASGLVISEVMHGKSDCASCEFIELYNPTSQAIDLKNLPQGAGELKIQFISSTGGISNRTINWTRNTLPAKSYFLFVSTTKLDLSSQTDAVVSYLDLLSQADAVVSYGLTTNSGIIITASNNTSTIDQIQSLGAEINQSLERNLTTNQFFIQTTPNPQNSLWQPSQNSVTEETTPISQTQEPQSEPEPEPSSTTSQPESIESYQAPIEPTEQINPGDVLINEFLPDPKEGENEWIELFNNTSRIIDLTDWQIEDNTGKIYGSGQGTKKLSQIAIASNSYFLLKKGEHFNFSLNNSGDVIILKQAAGTIIDQVAYGDFEAEGIIKWPKPLKGVSLARTTEGFVLSNSPTPGQPNLITSSASPETKFPVLSQEVSEVQPSVDYRTVEKSEREEVSQSDESSFKKITNLVDLRKLEREEKVEIEGIVAVLPGIFSKTIFYLDGIQIYLHNQNFPVLKIGDEVRLRGTISKIDGETRIKVKDKTDIKVLASGNILSPKKVDFEEIGLYLEGRLISVTGQIIERKDNKVYLIDDRDNEILIYLKESTGIKKSQFREGQYLEAIGILSQAKSGWRILPRFENDLKIIKSEESVENFDDQADKQPKEIISKQKSSKENKTVASVSGGSNQFRPTKYLIISVITLFIILIGLVIKLRFLA